MTEQTDTNAAALASAEVDAHEHGVGFVVVQLDEHGTPILSRLVPFDVAVEGVAWAHRPEETP